MSQARATVKAELMAKYEALLDELLSENTEGLSLTEIEELAIHTRGRVGEQVTTALLDSRRGQQMPGPHCPGCGQQMRYKGEKHRYLRTRSGDIDIERAYYYCPVCRAGLFPPG
jgi:hypothetical protein